MLQISQAIDNSSDCLKPPFCPPKVHSKTVLSHFLSGFFCKNNNLLGSDPAYPLYLHAQVLEAQGPNAHQGEIALHQVVEHGQKVVHGTWGRTWGLTPLSLSF